MQPAKQIEPSSHNLSTDTRNSSTLAGFSLNKYSSIKLHDAADIPTLGSIKSELNLINQCFSLMNSGAVGDLCTASLICHT